MMSHDLYRKILDVRAEPGETPDYYALLGLARFESDPERVHQAALATIAKLKHWQINQDEAIAQ